MPYKDKETRRAKYHTVPAEVRKARERARYHEGGKKEKMSEWYAANADKARAAKKRYYHKNREKILAKERADRRSNPEKSRRAHLRTRYGITLGEKAELIRRQGGCCAICGGGPGKKGWHTDHCHTTQAVRGVLCFKCNTGLGAFMDNPVYLRNAASYLEGYHDSRTSQCKTQDPRCATHRSGEEPIPGRSHDGVQRTAASTNPARGCRQLLTQETWLRCAPSNHESV
jgi:hypothetical protein